MKRPTMDQQERKKSSSVKSSIRRCSLCWEWLPWCGWVHSSRCMACEGTGYVPNDPVPDVDSKPDHCRVPGLRWQAPRRKTKERKR